MHHSKKGNEKLFWWGGTAPAPDHSPNPTTLSAYGAFGARPARQFYDLSPRSYISRYGPDRSRQIRSQSVHGLGSSDSPKIAISHWVAASPLQQSCTYCRATLWSMSIANHFQQMLNCWLRYLLLLGSLADLYILAIQDVPLVLLVLVIPKTLKRFVL